MPRHELVKAMHKQDDGKWLLHCRVNGFEPLIQVNVLVENERCARDEGLWVSIVETVRQALVNELIGHPEFEGFEEWAKTVDAEGPVAIVYRDPAMEVKP